VTLRGRGEPPDLVEVILPARPHDKSFVIRIPERGGLAHPDSGLPRGQLFLRIEAAEGSDPSASVAKVVQEVVALRRALDRPIAEKRLPPWLVPGAIALGVSLAALAWLLFHSR
jgi:hypothetical protein